MDQFLLQNNVIVISCSIFVFIKMCLTCVRLLSHSKIQGLAPNIGFFSKALKITTYSLASLLVFKCMKQLVYELRFDQMMIFTKKTSPQE